jgi:AbiU2
MPADIEIHRTVQAICIDLDYAIAFYETYVPTGQDVALIDRINESGFHPAFNAISDSLHQSVIVTLCRIWDTRRDTADLNSLGDAFGDAAVIADLAAAGYAIDPGQLSKRLSEIDVVNKSDELAALKRARHRGIAHRATPNSPYRGAARGAVFGDERIIIEKTIPLVEQAGAFIGYSYVTPFADQRKIRRGHATKFWAHLLA